MRTIYSAGRRIYPWTWSDCSIFHFWSAVVDPHLSRSFWWALLPSRAWIFDLILLASLLSTRWRLVCIRLGRSNIGGRALDYGTRGYPPVWAKLASDAQIGLVFSLQPVKRVDLPQNPRMQASQRSPSWLITSSYVPLDRCSYQACRILRGKIWANLCAQTEAKGECTPLSWRLWDSCIWLSTAKPGANSPSSTCRDWEWHY